MILLYHYSDTLKIYTPVQLLYYSATLMYLSCRGVSSSSLILILATVGKVASIAETGYNIAFGGEFFVNIAAPNGYLISYFALYQFDPGNSSNCCNDVYSSRGTFGIHAF